MTIAHWYNGSILYDGSKPPGGADTQTQHNNRNGQVAASRLSRWKMQKNSK
jgi:nickel-dependent lactate racemase